MKDQFYKYIQKLQNQITQALELNRWKSKI